MYTEQPEHVVEECTRLTTQCHCQNHICLDWCTLLCRWSGCTSSTPLRYQFLAFHSNPLYFWQAISLCFFQLRLPPNVFRKSKQNLLLLLPFFFKYKGWNFNFGNTMLDWIQALLEWRGNAAGRMGPSPTYISNGNGLSRNGHTQ